MLNDDYDSQCTLCAVLKLAQCFFATVPQCDGTSQPVSFRVLAMSGAPDVRIAWDGMTSTYEDFVTHYGADAAPKYWEAAASGATPVGVALPAMLALPPVVVASPFTFCDGGTACGATQPAPAVPHTAVPEPSEFPSRYKQRIITHNCLPQILKRCFSALCCASQRVPSHSCNSSPF